METPSVAALTEEVLQAIAQRDIPENTSEGEEWAMNTYNKWAADAAQPRLDDLHMHLRSNELGW